MILESNGDFYVQFASVSGLHSIRYVLTFIIAYLDEFKPSFSGGDIWKSSHNPNGSGLLLTFAERCTTFVQPARHGSSESSQHTGAGAGGNKM